MLSSSLIPWLGLVMAMVLAQGVNAEANYTLYHRFLHAKTKPAEFIPRGVVTVSSDFDSSPASTTATFQVATTDSHREAEGAAAATASDDGSGWYQVALQVGDSLITTSTRACLASSSLSHLTIHLTPPGDRPSSIELRLAGSRSCGEIVPVSLPDGPVEIHLKRPDKAQSPSLAPPIVVDATGQPATPPPEKSFLQKYWLPILGVGLFMLTQMGPDEPRPAAAAAK